MKFSTSVFFRLLTAACGAALAETLVDFIDCVIVGHVLGETALAGFELFLPVTNVVGAGALLVAGGTAVLHSQAMGHFDRERANNVFSTGAIFSVLLGLVGAIVLWFGLDVYLGFFGADDEVLAFTRAYGRVYGLVVLVYPLLVCLLTMVLEDGGDRVFSVASVATVVVDVVVSWLLARAFGIAGCAWGTLAAVVVAIAILLFHFRTKACSLAFRFGFSPAVARRILVANPGDPLSELMDAFTLIVINWFVVRRFGAYVLPVVALVFALDGLTFVFNGFSNAAQSLVGVYHSERNFKMLRSFSWFVLALTSLAGLAVSAFVMLWPSVPIALLGIDDPSLVPLAEHALRIVSVSYLFVAAFFFFDSHFAFIGKTALSAAISVLCSFVMPVACVAVCGAFLGLDGVWTGFAAAYPLAFVVFFGALALTRHRGTLPFLLPRDRDAALWTWNGILSAKASCEIAEQVEGVLKGRTGCPDDIRRRAPVLVEELLETVRERNGAKKVRAELTLDLNEGVEIFERNGASKVRAELTLDLNEGLDIFLRDTGEIFDITDADRRFDTFRAYFVTNAMAEVKLRNNLTTVGFNRNRLRLDAVESERDGNGEGDMEIKKTTEGTKMTLTLVGRLNTVTAPALEAEVENLPPEITDLVFDFTGLDYVSSAGIRISVAAHETLDDRGGTFSIVGANAQVKEVFNIAQLLSFIDFK